MELSFKVDLIRQAQKRLVESPRDFAHEITHHHRTWLLALDISKNINQKPNMEILEIICWWHDVIVKEKEKGDKRDSEITAEYLRQKFEEPEKSIIYDSVRFHEYGSNTKYLEGNILFDADKLEILSPERFRIWMESIKLGLYDAKNAKNAIQEVYTNWFPKLPDLLHFEYSKILFNKNLEEAEKLYSQVILELEELI